MEEINPMDIVLVFLTYVSPLLYFIVPIVLFVLIYRLFKHTNFLKNLGYFILTAFAFVIVMAIILGIISVVLA